MRLIRYSPPPSAERDDLVERIAELKKFIAKDSEALSALKFELSHFDYLQMFNRVTEGEIPWSSLCWPSKSNGGLPERYVCIVCKKGFKKFQGNYQSGCFKGEGMGQSYIHVHERCIPPEELRRIKDDIY